METDLHAPREFERLGSCFLQDDYEWGAAHLTEWAERAIHLTHLPPAQVQVLKAYIDDLLATKDDGYIEEVWRRFGGGFATFGGGGRMRAFWTTVRHLLDTVEIKSLKE
jgi:hypothetical protein